MFYLAQALFYTLAHSFSRFRIAQTLLQDQISEDYKELKTPLRDIIINKFTATELIRLVMRKRDEDEEEDDDEEEEEEDDEESDKAAEDEVK